MLPGTIENLGFDREERLAELRATMLERAAGFVARLVVLNGTAELRDPLTGKPRSAEAGLRLAKDSTLTVKTGRALVRMDDGSDLWLEGGATLDLSGWSRTVRRVKLLAGRALVLVAQEAARPFRAVTPLGEVLVTGTAFGIECHRDSLVVSVFHGAVLVENRDGEAAGRRGQRVVARYGRTPVAEALPAGIEEFWQWLGDLAASAVNAAVKPAYQGTRRALRLARPVQPAQGTRAGSFWRGLFASFAALSLLTAAYYYSPRGADEEGAADAGPVAASLEPVSSPPAPATARGAAPAQLGATAPLEAPTGNGAPPAGSTMTVTVTPEEAAADAARGTASVTTERRFKIRMIDEQGRTIEREVAGFQDLDALGALPKDQAARFRMYFDSQGMQSADGDVNVFVWNDGKGVVAIPPLPSKAEDFHIIAEGLDAIPEAVRLQIQAELLRTESSLLNNREEQDRLRLELEKLGKQLRVGDQFMFIERQKSITAPGSPAPPPAAAP